MGTKNRHEEKKMNRRLRKKYSQDYLDLLNAEPRIRQDPKMQIDRNPYWYFKPYALKKDTFRKFLDQSGITEFMTRVLCDIYDTEQKPPYPIHYFRKHFFQIDPEMPNIEFLIELLYTKRKYLTELQERNKELKLIMTEYCEGVDLGPIAFEPMPKVQLLSSAEDLMSEYTDEDFIYSSSTDVIMKSSKGSMKSSEKKRRKELTKEFRDIGIPAEPTLGMLDMIKEMQDEREKYILTTDYKGSL